jgi:hypothetical protein
MGDGFPLLSLKGLKFCNPSLKGEKKLKLDRSISKTHRTLNTPLGLIPQLSEGL